MEFTVKIDGLEMKVNLKDSKFIKEYLKNSQEFEQKVGIYVNSLAGYFSSSEEARSVINKIEIESLEKTVSLLNNYNNVSMS